MARPKSDVTISLKGKSGKTYRINLTQMPNGNWYVLQNGKQVPNSIRTCSEVASSIRKWLSSEVSSGSCLK